MSTVGGGVVETGSQVFEHMHADGSIERAYSKDEAISRCGFLALLAARDPEAANFMLEGAATAEEDTDDNEAAQLFSEEQETVKTTAEKPLQETDRPSKQSPVNPLAQKQQHLVVDANVVSGVSSQPDLLIENSFLPEQPDAREVDVIQERTSQTDKPTTHLTMQAVGPEAVTVAAASLPVPGTDTLSAGKVAIPDTRIDGSSAEPADVASPSADRADNVVANFGTHREAVAAAPKAQVAKEEYADQVLRDAQNVPAQPALAGTEPTRTPTEYPESTAEALDTVVIAETTPVRIYEDDDLAAYEEFELDDVALDPTVTASGEAEALETTSDDVRAVYEEILSRLEARSWDDIDQASPLIVSNVEGQVFTDHEEEDAVLPDISTDAETPAAAPEKAVSDAETSDFALRVERVLGADQRVVEVVKDERFFASLQTIEQAITTNDTEEHSSEHLPISPEIVESMIYIAQKLKLEEPKEAVIRYMVEGNSQELLKMVQKLQKLQTAAVHSQEFLQVSSRAGTEDDDRLQKIHRVIFKVLNVCELCPIYGSVK